MNRISCTPYVDRRYLLRATGTLILTVLLIAASGCASRPAMDSPRILEPGDSNFAINLSGGFLGEEAMPAFHLQYRRGIMERADFGVHLTTGAFGGDLRFQVVDGPTFVLAAGPDLSIGQEFRLRGSVVDVVGAFHGGLPISFGWEFRHVTPFVLARPGFAALAGDVFLTNTGGVGLAWQISENYQLIPEILATIAHDRQLEGVTLTAKAGLSIVITSDR